MTYDSCALNDLSIIWWKFDQMKLALFCTRYNETQQESTELG